MQVMIQEHAVSVRQACRAARYNSPTNCNGLRRFATDCRRQCGHNRAEQHGRVATALSKCR